MNIPAKVYFLLPDIVSGVDGVDNIMDKICRAMTGGKHYCTESWLKWYDKMGTSQGFVIWLTRSTWFWKNNHSHIIAKGTETKGTES